MSGETLLNNRYRLVAQQGSGGMAVIYKAQDVSLGRTVAVKILRPSLTADPQFIARFQNEARSIANLSHPNIVTVHDVGYDGPTNYMVMEFVEGSDLKKIIKTYGALGVDKALHYAIGMCAGLGFAHRSRIVHADVKPQNVLINKDDVVKITDFGIAQALTDTQPVQRASVVWGSPHYFAPEQAQGEKPSAASDVYSIGVVMFEMLTGRLPYTGTNQQELALAHIKEDVPFATALNPAVPESLARIVQKVMAKNPLDRYKQADQLGRVLIAYRDQGRADTMRENPVEVDNRPSQTPPAQPERSVQQTPPPPAQSDYGQQYSQIPSPPESLPTQRYNPAPNAPAPIDYQARQQRGNIPAPVENNPYQQQGAYGAPRNPGDSRPYPSQYPYQQNVPIEDDEPFTLDGVTIALAVLALMSWACLVPLWIAVLNARL